MTNDHNPVFSDIVGNLLGGRVMASAEIDEAEDGQLAILAEYAGFEVSILTSEVDGLTTVHIDSPAGNDGNKPNVRVYLNDTTLYDANAGEDIPDDHEIGEAK